MKQIIITKIGRTALHTPSLIKYNVLASCDTKFHQPIYKGHDVHPIARVIKYKIPEVYGVINICLEVPPRRAHLSKAWSETQEKVFLRQAKELGARKQLVGGLSKEEARKSVLCFMQNTWYVFYLIVTRFLGRYALLLTTVSQLPRGSMWFWLRFSSQSSNLAWWHGSVCSAVTRDDWQMCWASGHNWRGTV